MVFFADTASVAAVASAISDSDTSLDVSNFSGWPVEFPYHAMIAKDTEFAELVSVTNASGSTLTITRGLGSTLPQSHEIGETVEHVASGVFLNSVQSHMDATTDVHGVTGELVGTTNPQTLTNKTYRGAHVHVFTDSEPAGVSAGYISTADSAAARDGFVHDATAADPDRMGFLLRQSGADRFQAFNDGTVEITPGVSTRPGLNVHGQVESDDLFVDGPAEVTGQLDVGGDMIAQGNLSGQHLNIFDITGRSLVLNDNFGGGTLDVAQTAVIGSDLTVNGDIISPYLDGVVDGLQADIDQNDTDITGLNNPPVAEMLLTSSQVIPDNDTTIINWEGVARDSHSGWSAGTPSRWTAPIQGLYRITGAVAFDSEDGTPSGRRGSEWLLNGVTLPRGTMRVAFASDGGSSVTTATARSKLIQMAQGDYIELAAWHTAGENLTVNDNSDMTVELVINDTIA